MRPNKKRAPVPEWKFVFFRTEGPPIRWVGQGKGRDPIYDPLSPAAYTACRNYYDVALAFLSGEGPAPDINEVIAHAIPSSSFLEASFEEMQEDEFGPKVLIKIEDADRIEERGMRSPRWFDPAYVPLLILLAYAGGSFRFNDRARKKDKSGNPTRPEDRRLFLSFGRNHKGNIRVLRIIFDAPWGNQVHRKKGKKIDADFHYDHRHDALCLHLDDSEGENGRVSGFSKKGRVQAIHLAGEHLEAAIRSGRTLADPTLSRTQYEELLHRLFQVADELHRALQLADASGSPR